MKESARVKARLGAVAILAALCLVLVFQNTATVETHIFFWSVSMPQVVLLFATMGVGFAAGVVAGGILARKDKK